MRLKLKDLQPGKKYSIQLRTVTSDAVSEWSRKFTFSTVTDDTKPRTPTGLTLTPTSTSFSAEWNRVTKDIAGEDVSIDHYEVEWSSPDSAVKKVYDTKGLFYAFSIEQNRAVFGITKASVGVRVRAVNRHDVASDWTAIVGADNNPPAMPENLTATAIMDGVVLSWDANTTDNDLKGYRVYVGASADFIPDINNMVFEGDATTYTHYTSTYAPHFFKVTAFDEFGIESAPATASATPISPFVWDETPPALPTAFSGSIVTPAAPEKPYINLTWDYTANDDPDDLASFQIRWRATTDTATQPDPDNPPATMWVYRDLRILPANARQLKVTNIDNLFAAYEFEIRSVDETNNQSTWVGPITVTGGNGLAPDNPSVTTRVDQTSISFQVGGTLANDVADGNGVWHYDISTSDTFPVGSSTFSYDTGQQSLVVTGLAENTTYYYRVKVTDAEGLTSAWTTGSINTLAFPLPPGPTDSFVPAKVGAVTTLSGLAAINVSWPAVTTRSDGAAQPETSPIVYEVHASTSAGFAPATGTLVTQSGGTSALITKVAGSAVVAGTTYYIKVIAKDADGLGAPSDEVSGVSRKATGTEIESITAGQISTGSLSSATITMGSGGVIQSNNYVAGSSGYKLDETGLIIYNGTVSATAIKGGTISGTTVNIGAGGTLNVDSTAVVKSNNYLAGSTGWQLSSSGLEVNTGTIKADAIKGGTITSSTIYVGSGGGIYDVNGYWSITPSSINIQNGSINAGTITSGSLRSTKNAYDMNGNAIAGEYAWQIDTQGDAVFGNAYVRGRIVVGTSSTTNNGTIQSSNWWAGSTGWMINSNGSVEFNQATINAGLFKSQNSSMRLEVGNTGFGDPVDEVRMFNNGGVASMRHLSGSLGTIYFNLYNGAISLRPTSDGWTAVQRGTSGPMLKFVSSDLQARDSSDSSYTGFTASTVTCTGGLTVASQADFNGNVFINGIATAGTANMHIAASGRIYKISSSRRYKENIRAATIDTSRALELEPKIFQRTDERDDDDNILPVTSKSPWHYGFIAEEADELGFKGWTFSDLEGKTEGFAYDLWVVAQQAVLREHNKKIQSMETRISELEELLRSKL